jgi:hypothetical protein
VAEVLDLVVEDLEDQVVEHQVHLHVHQAALQIQAAVVEQIGLVDQEDKVDQELLL